MKRARVRGVCSFAALIVWAALCLSAGPAGAAKARVRVRGPGAAAIERAIGKVLARHGYKVARKAKKPALVVDGKVKGRGGKKVSVELTARAGKTVVGRLAIRAASRKAALRRVEKELWPAIESGLSRGGGVAVAEAKVDPVADQAKADQAKADQAKADQAKADQAKADQAKADQAKQARADRKRARSAGKAPRRTAAASAPAPDSSAGGGPDDSGSDAGLSASAELETEPSPAGPALSIAVGPEVYGRHFSYNDDLFEELSEYDLTGTPALGATAEWYPLADRRGALAGLGVGGQLAYAPTFQSEDVTGASYTSKSHSYAAGARYRLAVAGISLSAGLDYGAQTFTIAADEGAMDPEVPDVAYRFLRIGAGAAVPFLSRFTGTVQIGYRHILKAGEIESSGFFPRSSARGADAEVALRAAILLGFDIRVGAAVERYGFSLDPEPGDPRVAGGALDQYPRAFVRLGWTR